MQSIFDELNAKIEKMKAEGRSSRGVGPRTDIGLLLFSNKDAIRDLWVAAESHLRSGAHASEELGSALEKLRPLFGARKDP